MKFVRAIFSGLIILGSIYFWDNFGRDFFLKNLNSKANEAKQATPKEPPIEDSSKAEAEAPKSVVEPKGDESAVVSFEKGFEYAAKKAMHSVVNVATMQLVENTGIAGFPDIFKGTPFDDMLKDFFDVPQKKHKLKKANALGSGFIVHLDQKEKKAYIATNNHVVDKAKKIIISLSDKTELPATIHAVDARTDIGVLCVDLKDVDPSIIKKMKPIEWGDSNKLNEGNFVVAIGNPFGLGSTVTSGIVSAKGRNLSMGLPSTNLIDDFIQHSAQINMGNSGGCLLNIYGQVVGMNNAIFSMSGGNIGIGFAIPSDIARFIIEQLIKFQKISRGWLGAEVHNVFAKQAESVGLAKHSLDPSKVLGAYVARIVPNAPAEKAGVKVGDIIIEFNGKKISETCSLQNAVGSTEIGKAVKLKVWRQKDNGKWGEVELSAKVGDFEKAMKDGEIDKDSADSSTSSNEDVDINALGITVSALPNNLKSEYPKDVKVIVTRIDEDNVASFYGPIFRAGDGIVFANNQKVTSTGQFKKIIDDILKDKSNKNRPIPFVIVRGGSQMILATTMDFSEKTEK